MNSTELYNLIKSDELASNYAKIGDDTSCCNRVNEIAPIIRKPALVSDVKYLSIITGIFSKINILKDDPSTSIEIKSICIILLDWLNNQRLIDFDLDLVKNIMSQLVSNEIISVEQRTEFENLSNFKDTVDVNAVSECLLVDRPEGRI